MLVEQLPEALKKTRQKVVLLTGLSDPHSCALSDVQQHFLKSLNVDFESKVFLNFPYLAQFGATQTSPNLIAASWSNGRQFVLASRPRYRQSATAHWDQLVDSCEHLTVITFSCGLEILNSCLVSGRRPDVLRLMAIGPVAYRRPVVPHVLVRGVNDYISRLFFREVDVLLPATGHLDYLQKPELISLVDDWLTEDS